MAETNVEIRLVARPQGLPRESDFERTEAPLPVPGEGEVLVRNRFLSLDPAMRGWMGERASYLPPVELGAVMRGAAVGEVVASRHPGFAAGDRVVGFLGWRRYAVAAGGSLHRVPPGVPATWALGPLGAPGMTAYFGLLEIGRPQAGETVLVSAASGAVGSMVGQIARLKGCRAVGVTGGAEKCRYLLEELGFDAAVDYRAGDLRAALGAACPAGVDVYFDNVGGEILDQALASIRRGARVVLCGAVSQYNATGPLRGPSNYLALLVQRARMEGFIILDYVDRFPAAQAEVGRWLAEGKIRHREEVVEGLEAAPRALLRLFDGSKIGKLLVRLDAEGE